MTFNWKVVSGTGIEGFYIIETGANHANVQANKALIPSHKAAAYRYVVKNVTWDVDHFLLNVKTKTGTTQVGPFTVYEPGGKPSCADRRLADPQ